MRTPFKKSTFCDGPHCVEIAFDVAGVLVRDSKDPEGPTLQFTPSEWRAFLDGVRDGEFEHLVASSTAKGAGAR